MDSALRAVAEPQAQDAPQVPDPDVPAATLMAGAQLFAADRASSGDALGRAGEAAFLAELLLHRQVETPFTIGLLGAAGAGKSVFMGQVLSAAERLAAAAGPTSPFVGDMVAVRVDVSSGAVPDTLLEEAVLGRIAQTHPALAAELRHAGADPADANRRADAALDDARRKLDLERQALDSLTGREARLVDLVLDAPASLVDSYARSQRSRIERTQRQFGFGGGDPVATYKAFVREAAESDGTLGRLGLSLRALWAYRGQTRLIVSALVLFAVAYAMGLMRSDQANWLDPIRTLGDKGSSVADGLQGHLHWLGVGETVLFLLGFVLLLINILRAARFVMPLARGVDLLQQDLDGRRRDLGSQLAHQTRRVDALTADVGIAAREAGDAARRAGVTPPLGTAASVEGRSGSDDGGAVFRALASAMAGEGSLVSAPRRIVVAIDGLDHCSSQAAAAMVAALTRRLGTGCVGMVAAQPSHLLEGFGETDPARASAQFARCIQLPYRVGAAGATDLALRAYAATLIGGHGGGETASAIDPEHSALDAPWTAREPATVAALAPLAGETPRAIKHYVNLYRIARADPRLRKSEPAVFAALALALVLDAQGLTGELSALDQASPGQDAEASPNFRRALAAAQEALGQQITLAQAQRALVVAASYSGRMAS